MTLFNTIAVSHADGNIRLREMNLSKKQYYSRLSGLMDAGLIRRDKGKYSLTLLGKVVYDSQIMIGKALAHHWKLKALESIEMTAGASFPAGELTQLFNALIDNHQIKDIIMKSISVCSTKEDTKIPMVSAVVART